MNQKIIAVGTLLVSAAIVGASLFLLKFKKKTHWQVGYITWRGGKPERQYSSNYEEHIWGQEEGTEHPPAENKSQSGDVSLPPGMF
jgi:hypothetical protein